jgi:hypothetical protein
MIDESTEFGARVARHLREEMLVWLTTVTPSGAPLPRPVGFLWSRGDEIAVYSQPGAPRSSRRLITASDAVAESCRSPRGGHLAIYTSGRGAPRVASGARTMASCWPLLTAQMCHRAPACCSRATGCRRPRARATVGAARAIAADRCQVRAPDLSFVLGLNGRQRRDGAKKCQEIAGISSRSGLFRPSRDEIRRPPSACKTREPQRLQGFREWS